MGNNVSQMIPLTTLCKDFAVVKNSPPGSNEAPLHSLLSLFKVKSEVAQFKCMEMDGPSLCLGVPGAYLLMHCVRRQENAVSHTVRFRSPDSLVFYVVMVWNSMP